MTLEGTPFPTDAAPAAQWDALPSAAKWQIICFAAIFELWSVRRASATCQSSAVSSSSVSCDFATLSRRHNCSRSEGAMDTHYMKGGKAGAFPRYVSSYRTLLCAHGNTKSFSTTLSSHPARTHAPFTCLLLHTLGPLFYTQPTRS